MPLTLELYDESANSWIDKTRSCVRLRHSVSSRELEFVEFELVEEDVDIGQKVRVKRDGEAVFEGMVYERSRRWRGGKPAAVKVTAYSYLILYDRHVVYRLYPVGTRAGEIIRDLASLEDGVDVSNVDDGDSLLSPWRIENKPALEVMRSVARGVNYWLRMKPGLKLYFKPKSGGTPAATIAEDMILKAEYSEDRWKLKNRVIYVGAGGRILADVCEGGGDLPVVVHDPYLTDPHEAERRANIRLSLNKEYGRELRIEMHQRDFEDLDIDLGDTVIVDLPDLGLSNAAMFLLEIEYDPKSLRYRLILGGKLELFEESLREEIGGDVAARFGKLMTLPEQTSTLAYSLDKIARIQASQKHVVYVNKTPLTIYNAQNVILNSGGEAELISGATEGSFEAQVLPPSQLFINYVEAEWLAERGVKTVTTWENVFPPALDGWQYRKKITIRENAGQDLTDYQIKLTAHYGSGTDSGSDIYLDQKCKSDFGDVRFTDADGNFLAYWMEEKVDGDYAVFWVKVPGIPANGTADIYIYYGNPDAVYDGDGKAAFIKFYDFDTDESDEWILDVGSWEWDTANGCLKLKTPKAEDRARISGFAVETGMAIRTRLYMRSSLDAEGDAAILFGYQDGSNFYMARPNTQYDEVQLYKKVGGSFTKIGSASETIDADTWYILEVAWISASHVKVFLNDALKIDQATDLESWTSGGCGVRDYNSESWYDWILVRKYVEPEPSISAVGSEEYYLQETATTIIAGEISAQLLNADGESLSRIYDACDTQFYRFKKWPQGHGSFTYRNSGNWGSNGASASDKRMGILHGYCLKLTPDSLGSDGEIYYPSSRDLNLDLSWAKWLRLYLYADHEEDVTIKVRLHQDADNYFEVSLVVKAKEWRKYEISMDSLSQVGSPSLSQINWISIIAPYPILIDSDHVFLPAVRELMRVKFTLRRDSPDDPSPKIKLVKLVWREGA
ncbi:MAG: DUF2341 domain-containing protein [Thaumarchaeota archaeon]|nr:DUF2341 domain-containing protein [Nitrososphaerota archaeon]